jgi:hypothetical protein
LRLAPTFEVVESEHSVSGIVFQNVVRGGEHVGGYREDGFLGTPSTLQAEESLIIFRQNADHDHPGISITIAGNR